jgi:ligand-binding SRPBCC domain-containing protein
MASASTSQGTVIAADPHKVYDFVSEARRAVSFIPGLTRIDRVNPPQVQPGQTWEYEFDWFGFVVSGSSKCTKADRPHVYAFQTVTGSPSTWTYRFEPDGQGTRLTLEVEYHIPQNMLTRYASQGVLEKMNSDRAREIVENIKTMVED